MTPRATGKGIVLQERDYGLLADLLDSRLMTLKHAAELHFEGSIEAAKKRIQRLKAVGMIALRPRRPNDSAVHHLGRAGYLALKDAGRIDPAHDPGWAKLYKRQRTSDLMLRHELAVMDVKAALASAIRNDPTLELLELSTNPERHKFRVVEAVPARSGGIRFRSLYVKPDGLLHIRARDENGHPQDRRLFLEIDCGTESHRRLHDKVRHYDWYRRKGHPPRTSRHANTDRNGTLVDVLFIFNSETRLANFTSRPPTVARRRGLRMRFAFMDEILRDPIAFIPCSHKHTMKKSDSSIEESLLMRDQASLRNMRASSSHG